MDFGKVSDGTFKELTPAQVSEMDTEKQLAYFGELNKSKAKQLNDLEEKVKTEASAQIKTQIEELKADINKQNKDQLEVLQKALQTQGEALRKLMTNVIEDKPKTLADEIKANMDGIKKAIDKTVKEFEFTIKANVTRASVTNSTQALRLTDLGQLAHRKLAMRDVFQVVPVGAGSNGVIRYADWDEATKVRAAAMVAEGGTFPESTAAWAEYTLNLKKIGDTIPVTEEMVQDAGRFAAELNSFLETNVSIVEDTQLATGDGTGNNLNGIYPTAPTYTAVASGISDANIYDLLVKMAENITVNKGSKYAPNVGMMNIVDINRMKLKKDANENYIMPPFVLNAGMPNEMRVDNMLILEVNAFTANTLVIGDSRYGKIYEVEGYNVSVGYTGDQFVQDLMTLKGKKRENLLIRTADQPGFLKCIDIDAALVTLAL